MPKYDYDLIAIGAGAGGFVSSKLATGLGKKVAMIEKDRLGGECTNRGCVPSKALIKERPWARGVCARRAPGSRRAAASCPGGSCRPPARRRCGGGSPGSLRCRR